MRRAIKKSFLLLFLLFLGFGEDANAQEWVLAGGPSKPSTLIVHPNGNVISFDENNLWHSDDTGANWQMDTALQDPYSKLILDSSHTIFLVGQTVFRSDDISKTWNFVSTFHFTISPVYATIVNPSGIIFAATGLGTLLSTDNGMDWNSYYSVNISSLATDQKGILYEGSGAFLQIFRSEDTTKKTGKWFYIDSIRGSVQSLITDSYGNVFAGCYTPSLAVYRSIDMGQTWEEFDKGLTCTKITSLIDLPNGSIAAATDSGVFILPLLGCEWIPYSLGLCMKNVLCIGSSKIGQLYAGLDGCGIFKSTKLFNDTLNFTGVIAPGGPVDFQTQTTGSTSCLDVTLKNRGLKPLTISSFTVVDPVPFSLSNESAKKLPITLNPNDSIVMSICFHPPQPAAYISSVIWNTDIDPSLCGISRETKLQGVAIPQSSVQTSSPSQITFSLHPNPSSRNSVTLSFSKALSKAVAISVFDVLGREVYRNTIAPGLREFDLPIRDLAEGIYYARMELNGKTVTEQFVKVK